MSKLRSSRRHIYDPFVLKDIQVPLGKSGLKVIDWKNIEFVKKELEQTKKEAASAKD